MKTTPRIFRTPVREIDAETKLVGREKKGPAYSGPLKKVEAGEDL
jgi:hypothetical protein